MKNRKMDLARRGEDWIATTVSRKGWEILDRNWRRPGAELDLVLHKSQRLIIVEVKTRARHDALEDPFKVLSWRKRLHLIRSTELYISQYSKPDKSFFNVSLYLAVVAIQATNLQARWYSIEI